jgi:hypothetical protein
MWRFIWRGDTQKLWRIFVEELPRYSGALSDTNEERERADAIFEKFRQELLVGARSTAPS